MNIGLIQLRPYMAEALKEHLDGPDIQTVVFHTDSLRVQSVRLDSLHPLRLAAAIRSAPRCRTYIIGAFVWPAFTAALMSLMPGFRFGIEIGGWVGDAISPRGYQGEGRPMLGLRRAVYPAAFELIFSRADFIICNSLSLAAVTEKEYPRARGKTHAIHEGITFSPAPPGGGASGVSEPKILTVTSANAATKLPGVFTVLDAFDIVAEKHPGATLTCAVAASPGKPRERLAEVEARARRSPAAGRISILENVQDIHALYTGSYLMAYSTPTDTSDGLPRAIVEAQALGLPVVAGDTDGCPEAVNSGATGLIVTNTAEGIAEGMEKLIADRAMRNAMSAAAPGWFEAQFSWKKIAEDYKCFLLGRRR